MLSTTKCAGWGKLLKTKLFLRFSSLQAAAFVLLLVGLIANASGQDSDLAVYPVTKMPIPHCMSIVLGQHEYTLTRTGELHFAADELVAIGPEHFDVSASDRSAHVCFPMSAKLRSCPQKMVLNRFQILPNRTIVDSILDRRWPLGDFYLNDKGKAVVCYAEGIVQVTNTRASANSAAGPAGSAPRRRRACNYLGLSPTEYLVEHADNSLLIIPANRTVSDSSYTIDPLTLKANVCVPLTAKLLNCSLWALERNEVEMLPNKSLRSLPHQITYALGDYVLLSSGRVAVCAIVDPGLESYPDVEILHAAIQIVSALFLAASIVIHLMLPELSYQRAPILCHAFSFMITYLCLASRRFKMSLEPNDCYALFYITYYFVIASFGWLSVLAFDIWRITVHLRSGTTGYPWVNHFASKRFLWYGLFGWGFPVLMSILVTVVDRHEHIQDSLSMFPRIEMMCWFSDPNSSYAFLYGPMCIVLFVNFVFFVLSVLNIQRANNQVEFTNKKLNKQLLIICFVVFLAMGLFWIMELVSFVTNTTGIHWVVPDLINGSQGIFIAAAYTFRPLTWRLLREKFCNSPTTKQ